MEKYNQICQLWHDISNLMSYAAYLNLNTYADLIYISIWPLTINGFACFIQDKQDANFSGMTEFSTLRDFQIAVRRASGKSLSRTAIKNFMD